MKNIIDIRELQRYDNLEFIAREIVEGFITGLHRSPFHGFSVEFAEHRLYNQGESTKHIDWKLYARTEKLFVKRYEEETNLRSQIVIDTSSSMAFPYNEPLQSKLAFSVYSAAALIYLLRKQRDAVGLSLFTDKIDLQTPARLSLTHANVLYSHLSQLLQADLHEAKRKTALAESLHQIADSIHKRSLVIIFSDLLFSAGHEKLFSALQHLKHNKHEVILFHVIDKKRELQFDFKNRPYRFVDMESGKSIKLNPNEVRKQFVKSVSTHFSEIKLKCLQYKIDLIEADINEDFNQVLLAYLIKRNKLI